MKKTLLLITSILLMYGCKTYTNSISVVSEQPTIPVLTLKTTNPVLKILLIKNDTLSNNLKSLSFSLDGTTEHSDIKSLALYAANPRGYIDANAPISHEIESNRSVKFNLNHPLENDTTIVWLSMTLKDSINLLNRVNASITEIDTDNGLVDISSLPKNGGLRVGVALRQHKQDGVHTSRIPGLVRTNSGTLIATFDARYNSARDVQGDIDVCIQRSFDEGATWQPMQVVLDQGEWGGLPQKFNGVGDANILVDTQTGTIFVSAFWAYGIRDNKTGKFIENLTEDSTTWSHCWFGKGSQPGLSERETGQFLITHSNDDGKTWSKTKNLTRAIKDPKWWLFIPAPGTGITKSDGTLIIPSQGRDQNGLAFSNFIYSTDRGETWNVSNHAYSNSTECNIVELNDGSLMLNMRDNRNANKGSNENPNGETSEIKNRAVTITKDMGKTWEFHPTHRKALVESLCMACLYRYPYEVEGEQNGVLLFSNPNSRLRRENITIKASTDQGNSWPEEYWVLLDEYGGFGYSSMTAVNDSIVGILYESSQANLVFQQIPISEILAK